MDIKEVLNPNTILTNVNVNSKDDVFQLLTDCFIKEGYINNKDQFIKDVYERESIGVTGIGNYIAIPHGRSEAVEKPGVAIAILENEVEWESLDETGAKVVIMFAVGADNEGAMEHLKLLSMFSKRLGDDAVISKLFNSQSVDDVLNAFDNNDDFSESLDEAELNRDEITIM